MSITALSALNMEAPAAASAAFDPWVSQDEVVAALTSSGRLVLVRSVEEDLWQETLEVRVCA